MAIVGKAPDDSGCLNCLGRTSVATERRKELERGVHCRLLLDAIAGRLNLFVRSDEQEQAWRWVEPVLDVWERDTAGPRILARLHRPRSGRSEPLEHGADR